jgi:hypothetical protein
MKITFNEFLFESAPRLPKDIDYWKKKGKSGKDVCLIFHDDLDGIVSAIIMKNYLINQGFKIKQYGVINYQLGWTDFRIDSKLITIALDFAENIPGVSVYVDHHGKFSEEVTATQKNPAIKTATGSAAEGIAQQIGAPFTKETADWIDMIDSAKYSDYDIDIKGILSFDLGQISKSKNAKLTFAAAMNQLLKRSDDRTFIEVVNACKQPSIYNIYRLFKIFYPKNNPDWRSGEEPEFVPSGKQRLQQMEVKTRGTGLETQGFDEQGNKIVYTNYKDFWNDFAKKLEYSDVDAEGYSVKGTTEKYQLKPGVYQIIGNLMYVPSGTWANALRAKAIFNQDLEKGIVPDDSKLNFVLLQYGNTLQIADLRTKIRSMNEEDLPKDIKGNPIDNLGKYCEDLVKNFENYLDYQDERTVSGGHYGIGSISNIFGKCKKSPYEGTKFLDMFKNKIINDISGMKWPLTLPWNEEEEKKITIKPDEINKKLIDVEKVRSEEEATAERTEREILNYLISNELGSIKQKREYLKKFTDSTISKIYDIWQETHFDEIKNEIIKPRDLEFLYFNPSKRQTIEDTELFNQIVRKFRFYDLYIKQGSDQVKMAATDKTKKQRKELKRIFKIMFNITKDKYIDKNTGEKVREWIKK